MMNASILSTGISIALTRERKKYGVFRYGAIKKRGIMRSREMVG